MQNQGEPSVEEILDSIKKVIARDIRERDDLIAARRGQSPASDSDLSDPAQPVKEVLELGEEHAHIEADYSYEAEVLDDCDFEEADVAAQAPEADDDALTGGVARDAMRQNFAALAMLAQPGKQPQIVRQGETSLEGLTRELLRPMLAQWLDDNLPGMVEELVKAEIARIAGKKS